jgi:lipopolysaccharide biosynthesis regulator YciM
MSILEVILTVIVVILIVFLVIFVSENPKTRKKKAPNLYATALNHMLYGNYESAISCFKKIVKEDTDNLDAYIKLGILYRKVKKPNNAAKVHESLLFRQNISREQKLEILRNLVEDYVEAGDMEKALNRAEEILQIDKRNIFALENLWQIHRNLKNWDKAALYLNKVMKLKNEANPRLLTLYKVQEGLEKYDAGDYHEARLIFRKAIHIDPKCEAPYYYIAESYLKDNREKDALEWWTKFAEIVPEKANLIFRPVEKVLFDLGDLGVIEKFYEKVLSKKPEDIYTVVALANFYDRKGDTDRAILLLEEVLAKEPDSAEAKISMARLLINKNKNIEAKKIFDELIEESITFSEFKCSNCGYREKRGLWVCPSCGETDTFLGNI